MEGLNIPNSASQGTQIDVHAEGKDTIIFTTTYWYYEGPTTQVVVLNLDKARSFVEEIQDVIRSTKL